jgi:hypothetical protein
MMGLTRGCRTAPLPSKTLHKSMTEQLWKGQFLKGFFRSCGPWDGRSASEASLTSVYGVRGVHSGAVVIGEAVVVGDGRVLACVLFHIAPRAGRLGACARANTCPCQQTSAQGLAGVLKHPGIAPNPLKTMKTTAPAFDSRTRWAAAISGNQGAMPAHVWRICHHQGVRTGGADRLFQTLRSS